MYIVSQKKVTRSLSKPRAFLKEAPVCKKLIPKFVPIQPIFYHNMLVPSHATMASFMILGEFWIYRNLKTKFLNVLGRVTTPRCLNFILISSMGPRNSTKDTHVIFQPTLVHRSMCMQFIFRLCTLKVQKLN